MSSRMFASKNSTNLIKILILKNINPRIETFDIDFASNNLMSIYIYN